MSKLQNNQPIPEINPMALAKSVWQDIYVNTGKDPTKCLYNVVELFIFKFLSDLKILKKPYNFDFLLELHKEGNTDDEILTHYAKNSRVKIRELFPAGKDGTTIINGTIFVDSEGNSVNSQASLFVNSLKKYQKFGELKKVTKDFKTKLFETFLKQSQDKKKLGQFFTPRKLVSAIVKMSNIENLPDGSKFCDPFCGVGGFLCEPLHYECRKNDFIPSNKKILPKINYYGFDKGTDDDEERTIILAKANMLIYIADIVEKNPSLCKKYAKQFNQIFTLITHTNLGTLERTTEKEEDKYDLILTNPPYITSGVSSLKKEIKNNNLQDYYSIKSNGVEGLAVQWIIKNLKHNGRAFIIVPDSMLLLDGNKNLRDFIVQQCYIDGIISIPKNAFFGTPKKTYILTVTKKEEGQDQEFDVFTYIVSNIGETLDVDRFDTSENDFDSAINLFKTQYATRQPVKTKDIKYKSISIKNLKKASSWRTEDFFSDKEKIALELNDGLTYISADVMSRELTKLQNLITINMEKINKLNGSNNSLDDIESYNLVSLGNEKLFEVDNGERIRKQDIQKAKGDIPVYSSSRFADDVLGHVSNDIKKIIPNAKSFEGNTLTINADGSVGKVIQRNVRFYANDILNVLKIKNTDIHQEYVLYELQNQIDKMRLDYTNKLYKKKLRTVKIRIPVTQDKKFDLQKQKDIAEHYTELYQIQNEINEQAERFLKN